MCKYEMDPASIVEVTERTQLCPQTDGRTDGQMDGHETSIPVEAAGIINNFTPCFIVHVITYASISIYNMLAIPKEAQFYHSQLKRSYDL